MAKHTERRTRLADIAAQLGVSAAAVSMALNGSPRVSADLRQRAAAVARELGYVPNPAAAQLVRQRTRAAGAASGQWSVALLYRSSSEMTERFAKRCRDMGLVGQAYALDQLGTPLQAERQLWARGVSGLVLSVQSDEHLPPEWGVHGRAQFGWDRFSVVKLSRSLPDLRVDLVRLSAIDYFMHALSSVVARGYRRVAVLMVTSASERDNEARHGAYLAYQARRKPIGVELAWRELPAHAIDNLDPATIEWLLACAPDAVLCYHWITVEALVRQLPAGMHRSLGLAAVLSTRMPIDGLGIVSGCDVQQGEQVHRALGHLQTLMARGDRGFRSQPHEMVVEPIWIEGDTMRT
jgi:DNA-binding LacI/PurR family transcriptional regulator